VFRGWWKGTQREKAFLQAVIAGACAEFYTVLAPGSDRYHYNHIHVDLLVKNARNGRHYCKPAFDRGVPVAEAEADPRSTASVRPLSFVGPRPGED
jgi:Extensin-like protein C-terminus